MAPPDATLAARPSTRVAAAIRLSHRGFAAASGALRSSWPKRFVLVVALALGPARLVAQEAGLLGIVTSAGDGNVLISALVTVEAEGEIIRSTGTDRNGLYLIGGLAAGTYTLRVQTLGHAPFERSVTLEGGARLTINIPLETAAVALEGIAVEVGPEGAAIREFGLQRITPAEIRRVPTPAATGDLASYLQTLPGVVTTGDRGGQVFVRGGTHTENMTLMDGLTVYQPFHIVGFFSAFPEELVSSVDFYAGGFGARYHGRASSVMDVRMRDGNREHYSASASVSPFLAEGRIEGPLQRGRLSWIGLVRHSLIDRTSGSYLGQEQPISFRSQYLKVTATHDEHARCSAIFLNTSDEGRLDPEARESRVAWRNRAIGGRCSGVVDEAQSFFDINVGYSSVENDAVVRGSAELLADIDKLHAEIAATRLLGQVRFEYGYRVGLEKASYRLTDLFNRQIDEEQVLRLSGFAEMRFDANERLAVIPGVAITALPRGGVEPRFRMSWRPGFVRDGEVSGAIGLYNQDLMGISDVRDAGSVFVAWIPVPADETMQSMHIQLGWQQRHALGVNWSVEGYYRRIRNIGVPLWSTVAEYGTELGLANGSALGLDLRLEYAGDRFYGFLGYGLGRVRYRSAQQAFATWFGEPVQEYYPPHDRRHQVNTVLGYQLWGIDLSARWQLVSGLPFTRPLGFDEVFDYRHRIPTTYNEPGTPRVIVEKPYLGRLPLVHRLDLSAERGFDLPFGSLVLQAGAINAYGRTNMFYYDVFTHRRVDQLPFAPYAALKLRSR